MSNNITISVVNMSTCVASSDLLTMIVGINTLLLQLTKDWNLPYTVCILDIGEPKHGLAVYVVDGADTPIPESERRPSGKIAAGVILANDGGLFNGPNCIANFLSHEVFEMAADINATKWWKKGTVDKYFAAEICDPVQGTVVPLCVGDKLIDFSDWVLPSWTDVSARRPYTHMDSVQSPFLMAPDGYMINYENGAFQYKFGWAVPQWLVDLKLHESRLVKHLPFTG